MNNQIFDFLNEYAKLPSPQYAVLLRGKWGCGKTYFVKNWLAEFDKSNKLPANENSIELKPIYVSLFGMREISDIKSAIDRCVNPFFYTKAGKMLKIAGRIASKIIFKTELDIDKDGKSETSFSGALDSLSIFENDNKDEVNGVKFIIFDDLERCQIPMKQLLGFINYFVEHCDCHVVVVGEEKYLDDKTLHDLLEFKEKIVGREFEIATDIHSALDTFVNQTPKNDFVVGHQEQIEKFFAMTECNNLRILRQALWDFSRFEESMTDFLGDSRYEDIMIHVLGTYIISYCEYRGKNHQLLDKWIQYNYKGLQIAQKEIEQLKSQLGNFHQKYNNIYQRLSNYQTYKQDIIDKVILELNIGTSIKEYVEKEYFAPIAEVPSWDKINDAYAMNNNDFIFFYDELVEDICATRVTSMKRLGYAIAYLVYLDSRTIKEFSDTDFSKICDSLPKYLEAFKDEESVYNAFFEFSRGVNFYMTDQKLEKLPAICEKFNKEYENRLKVSKNLMTRTLEELSDSNVDELCTLNGQALPDHSCTYDMVSIFNHVDMDKLMDNLLKLNNESLNSFTHFIRDRYNLSYNVSNWIHETNDDIKPLEKLKEKVDGVIKTEKYIRKAAFMNLSKSLDGAIKRCKGDMHAKPF